MEPGVKGKMAVGVPASPASGLGVRGGGIAE